MPAGYTWNKGDWEGWHIAQLAEFYDGSTSHLVCSADLLSCEGGCFLDELHSTAIQRWQTLLNKTRQLGSERRVHIYQNSGIDTNHNASIQHADSAITDSQDMASSCVRGLLYLRHRERLSSVHGKHQQQL